MKIKFYLIAIFLVLSFLIVACNNNENETLMKEIDLDNNEYIENSESVENDTEEELGTYSFGPIGEEGYVYEGQDIRIPYEAECLSEIPVEFGLVLYVNGYPQEYMIEGLETNLDKKNIQVISLYDYQKVEFDIVFQPVEGEIGDVFGVSVVSIFNPNYLPENLEAPNFGIFHHMSSSRAKELSYKVSVGNEIVSDVICKEEDIKEVLLEEQKKAGSDTSYIDNNVKVDILQNNEDNHPKMQKLNTSNGKLDFTYRVMGGPNGLKLRSVIYVNNMPIDIDGGKVIETEISSGKMYSIDISLDLEEFNDVNSIFIVANPCDDSYMTQIGYPIKTRSYIFFDESLLNEVDNSSKINPESINNLESSRI